MKIPNVYPCILPKIHGFSSSMILGLKFLFHGYSPSSIFRLPLKVSLSGRISMKIPCVWPYILLRDNGFSPPLVGL